MTGFLVLRGWGEAIQGVSVEIASSGWGSIRRLFTKCPNFGESTVLMLLQLPVLGGKRFRRSLEFVSISAVFRGSHSGLVPKECVELSGVSWCLPVVAWALGGRLVLSWSPRPGWWSSHDLLVFSGWSCWSPAGLSLIKVSPGGVLVSPSVLLVWWSPSVLVVAGGHFEIFWSAGPFTDVVVQRYFADCPKAIGAPDPPNTCFRVQI